MNAPQTGFEYTGTDNLEVMMEAVRYNRFLTDQVVKHRTGDGAILDFGAGIGTFSEMVRERGANVDCLEVDADQCAVLRAKGFTAFEASADIPDASYDYIFSLNVFEHIEDDLAAMKEVHRILRPGGTIYTYVPAFQILFGDMDRKVHHFRRYTRKSLEALARDAGLEVSKSAYVDVAGFFASIVYNMISKGDGGINTGSVVLYDRFVFPISRAVDQITQSSLGKNVFCVAHKAR